LGVDVIVEALPGRGVGDKVFEAGVAAHEVATGSGADTFPAVVEVLVAGERLA